MSVAGSVAEIWRYPVKSMGGERLAQSAIAARGLHADRMWAVRDAELDTFTTARRWPVLLQCSARFAENPADRSRYATPVGALYDAYPILLLTRASLRALAARSPGSQFDVRRFRPNVLIDRDGAELVEFGWCGGRVRAPDVIFDVEIPDLRCSIPTRQQGDLPADPNVLRTINAHADHCLGVYANVAKVGTLAEGDLLEFEPSGVASAPAAVAQAGSTALKRGALRAFDALMPRGE